MVQGIKLGDFQATVSAFISAGLFFVVSQAKPRDKLSPERPHPGIFCTYVFASMLGQFALHTAFLIFVYNGALVVMPEVSLVFRFGTQQPHPGIFCTYLFASMLGQSALHTALLIFVYNGALVVMLEVSHPSAHKQPAA